jgi:hypothetical protein
LTDIISRPPIFLQARVPAALQLGGELVVGKDTFVVITFILLHSITILSIFMVVVVVVVTALIVIIIVA